MLVEDDFGVKYEGKQSAKYLINTLIDHYEISIDRAGKLFCGVSLHWDYTNRWVNLAMSKYIAKTLNHFQHTMPLHPQHAWPFHEPIKFDTNAQTVQWTLITHCQQRKLNRCRKSFHALLYYSHAMDTTMAVALSSIAARQAT